MEICVPISTPAKAPALLIYNKSQHKLLDKKVVVSPYPISDWYTCPVVFWFIALIEIGKLPVAGFILEFILPL